MNLIHDCGKLLIVIGSVLLCLSFFGRRGRHRGKRNVLLVSFALLGMNSFGQGLGTTAFMGDLCRTSSTPAQVVAALAPLDGNGSGLTNVLGYVSTNDTRPGIAVSLTNAANKFGGDGSLLTGIPGSALVNLPTNTAAFRFTPANPGNWYTGLGNRVSNTAQRATLELDLGFVDAATGTPVALITIEQGLQITNKWTCSTPGTIVSTVTNHYSFKLTTNAVVIVTDISRGSGASVTISTSQLTSE